MNVTCIKGTPPLRAAACQPAGARPGQLDSNRLSTQYAQYHSPAGHTGPCTQLEKFGCCRNNRSSLLLGTNTTPQCLLVHLLPCSRCQLALAVTISWATLAPAPWKCLWGKPGAAMYSSAYLTESFLLFVLPCFGSIETVKGVQMAGTA